MILYLPVSFTQSQGILVFLLFTSQSTSGTRALCWTLTKVWVANCVALNFIDAGSLRAVANCFSSGPVNGFGYAITQALVCSIKQNSNLLVLNPVIVGTLKIKKKKCSTVAKQFHKWKPHLLNELQPRNLSKSTHGCPGLSLPCISHEELKCVTPFQRELDPPRRQEGSLSLPKLVFINLVHGTTHCEVEIMCKSVYN